MISKADIFSIATSVGIILTDVEIDWVLLCYEDAQRQDPSGTWDLVVEDLCHQAVAARDDEPFDDSEERRDFGNDDDADADNNPAFPFHTDGDGDDDTLLNFMG